MKTVNVEYLRNFIKENGEINNFEVRNQLVGVEFKQLAFDVAQAMSNKYNTKDLMFYTKVIEEYFLIMGVEKPIVHMLAMDTLKSIWSTIKNLAKTEMIIEKL